MNSFFVGKKTKPSFLLEVIPDKKTITIYAPDKHSKNEEFYEKYALGETVLSTKFDTITFIEKPSTYKQYMFTPIVVLKIKNKYYVISNTITETRL